MNPTIESGSERKLEERTPERTIRDQIDNGQVTPVPFKPQ